MEQALDGLAIAPYVTPILDSTYSIKLLPIEILKDGTNVRCHIPNKRISSAKRQAPSAKRQAPSAKRQAPSARLNFPLYHSFLTLKQPFGGNSCSIFGSASRIADVGRCVPVSFHPNCF
jgi:hypothetical protein